MVVDILPEPTPQVGHEITPVVELNTIGADTTISPVMKTV
jgi:hypothetical protein